METKLNYKGVLAIVIAANVFVYLCCVFVQLSFIQPIEILMNNTEVRLWYILSQIGVALLSLPFNTVFLKKKILK